MTVRAASFLERCDDNLFRVTAPNRAPYIETVKSATLTPVRPALEIDPDQFDHRLRPNQGGGLDKWVTRLMVPIFCVVASVLCVGAARIEYQRKFAQSEREKAILQDELAANRNYIQSYLVARAMEQAPAAQSVPVQLVRARVPRTPAHVVRTIIASANPRTQHGRNRHV
jgi:hypothetical protein